MWTRLPGLLAGLVVLNAAAIAQPPAQLSGPISSFIFDHDSRAIRGLRGVPGAATVGRAVISDVDFAAVAPNGRTALMFGEGRLRLVRNLTSATISTELISDALPLPAQIVWSLDSSSAVVAAVESVNALWIKITPKSVQSQWLDLHGLVSAPRAIALTARGDAIAAVVDDAAMGALYRLSASHGPIRVLDIPHPVGITFLGYEETLYVLSQDLPQLFEINQFVSSPAPGRIINLEGSITKPSSLGASKQAQALFVASETDRVLQIYDVNGVPTASLALDQSFETIYPVNGDSRFLLCSARQKSPALLVFETSLEPAIFFIPPPSN